MAVKSLNEIDKEYIAQALKLAKNGLYTAAPNPCVGCIIVKDNEVLGSGFHIKAGTPHAEVWAIRNSGGRDLTDATAYVTLEPCSHFGLTPPCAKALVEAKVKRVVCAMVDPNPLVAGKGIKILEDAGIEVKVGVLENEAQELNKSFLYAMKHNLPYVTVKYGMSLDGKVAMKSGESKWITSTDSRKDVQRLRLLNQAILTSATTVLADNPSLNVRYDELPRDVMEACPRDLLRQPLKVVVDSKARVTDYNLNIFKTGGKVILVRLSEDNDVYTTDVNENISIMYIPSNAENANHIDMKLLLSELHKLKIRGVLVEAGGTFVGNLFKQNLVNEVITYIAPKVLGKDAMQAFAYSTEESLQDIKNMQLFSVETINNDVKLIYRLN